MFNLFEIVLYSLTTLLFFYFLYVIITLYTKNKKFYSMIIQAQAERDHFRLKLAEQIAKKDGKKLEQTDGFVRFISQSRDWAFEYIEKVQDSIKYLQETREDLDAEDILISEKIDNLIKAVDQIIEHLPNDSEEK
jgi:predicted RNA-binding protein with EMAP domain